MIVRLSQALACLFLLMACTITRFEADVWPDSVPARDYFDVVYAADEDNQAVQSREEYLLWVLRFYEGWELYGRGWKHVTEDVLRDVDDPNEYRELADRLADVGLLIAAEWSKKSERRRIRTPQLSVWGNTLLEAVERGEQSQILIEIQEDIDDLFNHRLLLSDITRDRYYASDPHDVFR
jgi:hypothetical protein